MIPINVDRNVGPSAYRMLEATSELLVTSTFYTFQGEGPYAGRPAWFLRLAGCNLGAKKECPWCDTRFNYDEGHRVMDVEIVDTYAREGRMCGLVVVTGGEPLLQWPVLRHIIAQHNTTEFNVPIWQFETNGVYLDDTVLREAEQLANVHFVVSPKVLGDRYRPIPPEWRQYDRIVSLKYVVSADPRSNYHHLPSEIVHAKQYPLQVYVSGQTEYGPGDEPTRPGAPFNMLDEMSETGRLVTAANYSYAAKLALELGFRVSFQTHLLAGVE